MTNVLIRKLINHGYTPEDAYRVCHDYMRNLSLTDLEALIEVMEEYTDVDKVQSKSNRQKCGRLRC